ncbi:MAG: hypothetical protein ACLTSX_09375 [Collinsella sp.]
MPVLEAVSRAGKGLLIIAEDIDGEALPTLVLNKIRVRPQRLRRQGPGYGDRRKRLLEDIAILTGGRPRSTSSASRSPTSPPTCSVPPRA